MSTQNQQANEEPENQEENTELNNFFSMPDEEIMGMNAPEVPKETSPAPVDETEAPVETDTDSEDHQTIDDGDEKPDSLVPPKGEQAPKETKDENQVEKPAAAEPAPIDYEAEYKRLMAPFKANGKEFQPQSPDEAVKLMQMGANYTKKMQALQPVLRLVRMLENNQLMDENRLSYLIDLSQGKPEAIQKLLADSKFDPLEADVEKAASYVPGDHRVSDLELQFQTVLEDVESTPTGPELLSEVAKQWDADSKQTIFKEPALLLEINKQKASGLYGLISAEIERRRILGELRGVPFLAAYEAVGRDLQARGLLNPQSRGTQAPVQKPPVQRVVAPNPKVSNDARARAAAPTRAAPSQTSLDINVLAQSDEEFIKQMNGRL